MSISSRRLVVLGILLALTPVASVGSLAPATAAGGVRWERCDSVVVAIRVPEGNVQPLVPEPFRIQTDAAGNAQLSVVMVQCDLLTVDGGPPRKTTLAHPAIALDPPPEPFQQSPSQIPPPTEFYWFQLWLVTDNPDLVEYLRRRGSTGPDVRVVDGLAFEVGEDGGFWFDAPAPAPSPFTVAGRLGPLTAVGIDIHPRWYWRVPHGVAVIDDDLVEGFRFGPFTDWRIDPAPGSLLDDIICDSPRTFDEAGGPLRDESLSVWFDVGTFTVSLREDPLDPPGDVTCTRP